MSAFSWFGNRRFAGFFPVCMKAQVHDEEGWLALSEMVNRLMHACTPSAEMELRLTGRHFVFLVLPVVHNRIYLRESPLFFITLFIFLVPIIRTIRHVYAKGTAKSGLVMNHVACTTY